MQQLSKKDSKRIAKAWSELYGKSLAAEAEAIHRQSVDYLLPRADQTVTALLGKRTKPPQRRSRGPALFMSLAAAACLMLVAVIVGVPYLTDSPWGGGSTSPQNITSSDSYVPQESTLAREAEMIPLTFSLPSDFRVASSELDNGVTFYTLASESHGDVVLAMFQVDDEHPAGTGGQAPGTAAQGTGAQGTASALADQLIIDGTPVAARIDDSYVLIEFQHQDVFYTLTSRDNLGALAALYRNIVAR